MKNVLKRMHGPEAGVLCAALAYALNTVLDALNKCLTARYSVFEIAFGVSLFSLLPIVLAGGWRAARETEKCGFHLARAAAAVAGGYCSLYALGRLSLTDAYAVAFSSPVIVAALSAPVLGERVGAARWTGIAAGFLGVLFMLRPSGAIASPALAGAVASTCIGSTSVVLVRRAGAGERGACFAFFGALVSLVASGLMMTRGFVVPSLADLALMALGGTISGTAGTMLMHAYRITAPATVAPFQYSQLIWGSLAAAALWGDRPDAMLCLGGAIVAGSGLYVARLGSGSAPAGGPTP